MNKKIIAGVLASVMAVASATAVSAKTNVSKVDTISGDLTVTSFFGEKTDAVELKDGGSYTIKFHSKSNGTNNWDTFVVALAGEGALAAEYPNPGGPVEALIFRGDNWGWGGELSDIVAPDGATDNKLVFEGDINFDNWVTEGQAGFDVEIALSRSGNSITYDAKIGSYSVKTTATSGKALPESLYVFLTGENVELTGISVTGSVGGSTGGDDTNNGGDDTNNGTGNGNTNTATDDKQNADTGIEGVAIAAGLAIVAAGAVVVAKKRK